MLQNSNSRNIEACQSVFIICHSYFGGLPVYWPHRLYNVSLKNSNYFSPRNTNDVYKGGKEIFEVLEGKLRSF